MSGARCGVPAPAGALLGLLPHLPGGGGRGGRAGRQRPRGGHPQTRVCQVDSHVARGEVTRDT